MMSKKIELKARLAGYSLDTAIRAGEFQLLPSLAGSPIVTSQLSDNFNQFTWLSGRQAIPFNSAAPLYLKYPVLFSRVSVLIGTKISMAVAAIDPENIVDVYDTSKLIYRWMRDGQALTTINKLNNGFGTKRMQIAGIDCNTTVSGDYTCTISNGSGTTTSTSLTINVVNPKTHPTLNKNLIINGDGDGGLVNWSSGPGILVHPFMDDAIITKNFGSFRLGGLLRYSFASGSVWQDRTRIPTPSKELPQDFYFTLSDHSTLFYHNHKSRYNSDESYANINLKSTSDNWITQALPASIVLNEDYGVGNNIATAGFFPGLKYLDTYNYNGSSIGLVAEFSNCTPSYFTRDKLQFEKFGGKPRVAMSQTINVSDAAEMIDGKVYGINYVSSQFFAYIGAGISDYKIDYSAGGKQRKLNYYVADSEALINWENVENSILPEGSEESILYNRWDLVRLQYLTSSYDISTKYEADEKQKNDAKATWYATTTSGGGSEGKNGDGSLRRDWKHLKKDWNDIKDYEVNGVNGWNWLFGGNTNNNDRSDRIAKLTTWINELTNNPTSVSSSILIEDVVAENAEEAIADYTLEKNDLSNAGDGQEPPGFTVWNGTKGRDDVLKTDYFEAVLSDSDLYLEYKDWWDVSKNPFSNAATNPFLKATPGVYTPTYLFLPGWYTYIADFADKVQQKILQSAYWASARRDNNKKRYGAYDPQQDIKDDLKRQHDAFLSESAGWEASAGAVEPSLTGKYANRRIKAYDDWFVTTTNGGGRHGANGKESLRHDKNNQKWAYDDLLQYTLSVASGWNAYWVDKPGGGNNNKAGWWNNGFHYHEGSEDKYYPNVWKLVSNADPWLLLLNIAPFPDNNEYWMYIPNYYQSLNKEFVYKLSIPIVPLAFKDPQSEDGTSINITPLVDDKTTVTIEYYGSGGDVLKTDIVNGPDARDVWAIKEKTYLPLTLYGLFEYFNIHNGPVRAMSDQKQWGNWPENVVKHDIKIFNQTYTTTTALAELFDTIGYVPSLFAQTNLTTPLILTNTLYPLMDTKVKFLLNKYNFINKGATYPAINWTVEPRNQDLTRDRALQDHGAAAMFGVGIESRLPAGTRSVKITVTFDNTSDIMKDANPELKGWSSQELYNNEFGQKNQGGFESVRLGEYGSPRCGITKMKFILTANDINIKPGKATPTYRLPPIANTVVGMQRAALDTPIHNSAPIPGLDGIFVYPLMQASTTVTPLTANDIDNMTASKSK